MHSPPRSQRSLRTAALFGLSLPLAPRIAAPQPRSVVAAIARAVQARHTVLITGPSGGGKSTLLGTILATLAPTCSPLIHLCAAGPAPERETPRPLIDTLPGPLPYALALAAACGLADARLLLTPTESLSTGEAARRLCALALHAARSGALAIDEFGASLDSRTAHSLARAHSRAASRADTALILVTNRPRIAAHLSAPLLRVHCPLHSPARVLPSLSR